MLSSEGETSFDAKIWKLTVEAGNFQKICNKHTTRIDKSDIVLVCGVCIYTFTYYIVVNAFTNY